MSSIKVNEIQPTVAGGGVKIDGQQIPTEGPLGGSRNIFINADCRIAQRGTASQSHSAVGSLYGVDRFYTYASVTGKVAVQQNQGNVTPPPGFQKYVGITSSSAYTSAASNVFSFGQAIEASNASQLSWGTADAKTVTLSFWVRSSLTGTFGGAFLKQGLNRSYPYSYTINSANTWEYKTITIPGDTDTSAGYTMSGNGLFGYFIWDYGSGDHVRGTAGAWVGSQKEGVTGTNRLVGTNGATWYITGIQLEVGSKATSFEHKSYGDELALCQRYYKQNGRVLGIWTSTQTMRFIHQLDPHMRAAPTVALLDANGYHERYNVNGYTGISSTGGVYGSHTAQDFVIQSSSNRGRNYNDTAMLGQDVVSFTAEL